MERYSRILIIMFFMVFFNLILSLYILTKPSKPNVVTLSPSPTTFTKMATPMATTTAPPNIQSDLNVIKAEIRALRESLNSSGLILETPKP